MKAKLKRFEYFLFFILILLSPTDLKSEKDELVSNFLKDPFKMVNFL